MAAPGEEQPAPRSKAPHTSSLPTVFAKYAVSAPLQLVSLCRPLLSWPRCGWKRGQPTSFDCMSGSRPVMRGPPGQARGPAV